jgi:hypothetical protein
MGSRLCSQFTNIYLQEMPGLDLFVPFFSFTIFFLPAMFVAQL